MTDNSSARGPNKYPEPRTDAQRMSLEVTCRYLGRTFYEGDTICYRGGEWRCSSGDWVETGATC